jgi:general secretion pathway protein D
MAFRVPHIGLLCAHRAIGFLLLALTLGACENNPFAPSQPANLPRSSGPVPTAGQAGQPGEQASPTRPIIDLARGGTVRPPQQRIALAQAVGDDEVTLNFVNASLEEVLKAVMGDILGANYVVDPKAQGSTVTLQTNRPIKRSDVLPVLERVLQGNGLALVQSDGTYQVVPRAGAAPTGAVSVRGVDGPVAGHGTEIIPLRYTSARQLRAVLEPFVPQGAIMQTDDSRNMVIVSGTRTQIQSFAQLVTVFDVDWLSGMSFGLFPLEHGTATSVARELGAILETAEGPLARVVRIVPLDRISAVLVASAQPDYIARVQTWIERLDTGWNDSVPRLYVYHVQNSRAGDLAKVLERTFVDTNIQQIQPQQGSLGGAGGYGGGLGGGGPLSGGTVTPQSSGGAIIGGGGRTSSTAPSPQPLGDTSQSAGPAVPAVPRGRVETGEPAAPTTGGFGAALGAGPAPEGAVPPPRIVADEKNNTLVIYARPRDYRMIESALKRLDILPLQVLIEATVAEVTLTDELNFGLQWFFQSGNHSLTLSRATSGAISQTFPGFDYLVSTPSARVVLNALSDITNVNVVSAPQLMVLDHQTAVLQVGDEVPIAVQQARSVTDPDAPLVNSIALRDTGVILRVTPRVNQNGMTILEVEQEVSDVTTTTTSNIDSPTIQQRRIRSTVSVADGETLALGGLIRDNNTTGKSGIPGLSDIPVFGALFGARSRTRNRTELLILLTPRVVRNPAEARSVTDDLRRRMNAPQFPPAPPQMPWP